MNPIPMPGNDAPPTLPPAQSAAVPGSAAPGAVPAAQPAAGAPMPALPAMADDGDLIEKEWVNKVKHVVQATAQDPYELNRQFTKIKADYMQKRYGKTIKSGD